RQWPLLASLHCGEMSKSAMQNLARACRRLESVDRLRLGSFENLSKAWVGPQWIPLPSQAQLGQDETSRSRKKRLDRRDRLIDFASPSINDGENGCIIRGFSGIFTCRNELDCTPAGIYRLFLATHEGVELP